MGASLAISMIPGIGIAGLLLGCMMDGTFTDMLSALKAGDWAMLGMCALAFVPGMKQAKMGFKLLGHADDVGKITRKLDNHLNMAIKEAKLTAKQEKAALKNPNLRKAFMGERIDTAFKKRVMNDPSLEGVVKVTPRFQKGADVYLAADDSVWWDVTTGSQWGAHERAYGSGGIPLIWD